MDVTRGRVPVSIEVRDDDGGLRLGDDHADIDPTNGGDTFNLDLSVNLAPCAVSGDRSPQCERFTSCAGTADNNKARIFYKVEVIEADNDNDALPDSWETRGLDTDGDGAVDVDLAAMGADPNRQDVFVEVDCLAASAYNHCPMKDAIDDVVRAFADDPRSNPDGTTGVQLHVDTGSLYGAKAVTKVRGGGGVTGTYGDIGAAAGDKAARQDGDQIPETAANQIGAATSQSQPRWSRGRVCLRAARHCHHSATTGARQEPHHAPWPRNRTKSQPCCAGAQSLRSIQGIRVRILEAGAVGPQAGPSH